MAETQDYSRLREAIIQYDSATLKWNNAMMLGQEVNKDGADRIMEKGKPVKARARKTRREKASEQKGGKRGGKGKGQLKCQDLSLIHI